MGLRRRLRRMSALRALTESTVGAFTEPPSRQAATAKKTKANRFGSPLVDCLIFLMHRKEQVMMQQVQG